MKVGRSYEQNMIPRCDISEISKCTIYIEIPCTFEAEVGTTCCTCVRRGPGSTAMIFINTVVDVQ
jgi:hypothetical protein